MRKWRIIYWKSDNLGEPEQTLIIKNDTLDDVIQFCKMKGLKSYCVFDDLDLNVCVDGKYTILSKYARKNALAKKGKENEIK